MDNDELKSILMQQANPVRGGMFGDAPNQNAMNTYSRNQQYANPAPVMAGGYQTKLDPLNEMAFQNWVQQNNIPFDPSATSDYDMRGYYQAMKNGQVKGTSLNANDGQQHYTDTYKTPYHESFSAESKYANGNAPQWNFADRLQDPQTGATVFDEKKNALLASLLRK